MRLPLDEEEKVDIQMSPLIDCVFLLLIFFLVASGDDFQLVDNPFGGKYGHYCRG